MSRNSKQSKLRAIDKAIERAEKERAAATWYGDKTSLTRQISALREVRKDIEQQEREHK